MEPSPASYRFLSVLQRRLLLENSSDGKDGAVGCAGYDDARSGCGCMHDLSITRVDSHMPRIADDIARLRVLQTVYGRAHASVRR